MALVRRGSDRRLGVAWLSHDARMHLLEMGAAPLDLGSCLWAQRWVIPSCCEQRQRVDRSHALLLPTRDRHTDPGRTTVWYNGDRRRACQAKYGPQDERSRCWLRFLDLARSMCTNKAIACLSTHDLRQTLATPGIRAIIGRLRTGPAASQARLRPTTALQRIPE
jgi:hypothetical protein